MLKWEAFPCAEDTHCSVKSEYQVHLLNHVRFINYPSSCHTLIYSDVQWKKFTFHFYPLLNIHSHMKTYVQFPYIFKHHGPESWCLLIQLLKFTHSFSPCFWPQFKRILSHGHHTDWYRTQMSWLYSLPRTWSWSPIPCRKSPSSLTWHMSSSMPWLHLYFFFFH